MAQFAQPAIDLPASYYAAIGEFLFRFAHLEYQLHEIIWASMGLGYKSGRTLTIGTNTNSLRAMIRTIALGATWLKGEALRKELKAIANEIKDHASWRNAIAHASWQSPYGTPDNAHLHFIKETPPALGRIGERSRTR
jgi:hypothetical protein